ncbi:epoxide hydrolase family protein [Sphingomonas phyllosphaerae]|uniref:epoxide hydrolase family protein n=1 Tax=Sphingomonas phyllosphaerae TaxID=257003 RepID=UPI002FF4A306
MAPQAYRIAITDAALTDLKRRLIAARLVNPIDPDSSDDGTSLRLIRRLADRWIDGFDWRAVETRLNRLPQFISRIDGLNLHYVHQRGVGPAPMPLILTHGWPGSFIEMEQMLPLLTDPAAHGGEAVDAFDVVIPSLPGYGLSQAPSSTGVSAKTIAGLWAKLMAGLGYSRYGAHGGDIGAGVSMWLARQWPEALTGIHVNYIPGSYSPPVDEETGPITSNELAFLEHARTFAAENGAYEALQSTRPQTLAYALSDSPIGLAAWMAEKFDAWSDHDGNLEDVIPLDTVITNIAFYWFSGTIDASLRLYKENRLEPLAFIAGERVPVPLGVAVFPRELPMPPRSWVERVFDVRRWSMMPKGGHFAALEQPAALAADIRAFFRPLR